MYPYIITHDSHSGKQTLTVVMDDGAPRAVTSDNSNFYMALQAIRDDSKDDLKGVFDRIESLKAYASKLGSVEVENNTIKIDGEVLPAVLATRIQKMQSQGVPVDALKAFWHNLKGNPTPSAVNELYQFLEQGVMPITEDGCFLAYKYVNDDYTDCYSGKMDNSVGKVVSMKRSAVDPDRTRTCSQGLHFGALSYMPSGGRRRIMIVKVNPADVVAIPIDYNYTKGRTWKYEVVAEYTGFESGKEVTQKAVVEDVNSLDLDNGEKEEDLSPEDEWDWWNEEGEYEEEIDASSKPLYEMGDLYVSYYDAVTEAGPAYPSALGMEVRPGMARIAGWTGQDYARDACYYLKKLINLGYVVKLESGQYQTA